MNAIAQKLRSLINPAYAAQLGTESYERRVSADEIERLELEVELLTSKIADCRDAVPAGLAGDELAWAVASTEGVAEYVKAAFKQIENEALAATLRIENDAATIYELKNDAELRSIGAMINFNKMKAERDELRAELAALKQQEPVTHQFQAADYVPLSEDYIRAEFATMYPNDDGILRLSENNHDYAIYAIGASHHWMAFKDGARAGERAVRGVK